MIKKNLPIRNVIIITFMASMLVSIGVIGYMVFSSWFASAKQTTENFAKDVNEYIYDQIYTYLNMPVQINEANYKIIANEILDIYDEPSRDKFFVGALESYERRIYSFSCGTANGEYYGARRNDKGESEIMRNNAATGGNSWYYSVNKDLTAGELAVQAGKFDPRTRDWYKSATAIGAPTFSPIYKHFIMDDLTISHARPIYNQNNDFICVLGTHMLLDDVGDFLDATIDDYDGYAVIFEKNSNKLIANSMDEENFTVSQDGTLKRHDITKIQNFDVHHIYSQYQTNLEQDFFYKGKSRNFFVNVKEIQMTGLNWIVISVIPEDYLLASTIKTIYFAVILAAAFLLLSFIIYVGIMENLLKPINNLLKATDEFLSGNLTKRIDIVRNDEIGKISGSFNNVAEKMQFLVNNLEAAVKERTEEIQYLSCYDTLTGLYNRRCFEEHSVKIDSRDNLPLSIIFADINGLKMTNDIFGHRAGDELIKKTADILREACRQDDIIARVGGDEFVILMPKTTRENAEKILERIEAGFTNALVRAIKCSISLGFDTKQSPDQPLEKILMNAESAMYKDKTLNRKSVNKEIINTIIETLHKKSPQEKQHSVDVAELCVSVGKALQLSEAEINKLSRAAYLHDIGKIVLDDNILNVYSLHEDELEIMRQHSMIGYRILNLFDDTLDLAEYVYAHHEKWDGTGYPRGLRGEQIPLLSRIISIVETYDRKLHRCQLPMEERKMAALAEIKKDAGTLYDPKIVKVFSQIIKERPS